MLEFDWRSPKQDLLEAPQTRLKRQQGEVFRQRHVLYELYAQAGSPLSELGR